MKKRDLERLKKKTIKTDRRMAKRREADAKLLYFGNSFMVMPFKCTFPLVGCGPSGSEWVVFFGDSYCTAIFLQWLRKEPACDLGLLHDHLRVHTNQLYRNWFNSLCLGVRMHMKEDAWKEQAWSESRKQKSEDIWAANGQKCLFSFLLDR